METIISQAQNIIVYRFQNPNLLWEAVQVAGSGVYRIGDRDIMRGNENLAIYGDAVMASVLCKQWYTQGGNLGTWDQYRQRILSNGNLARIASATGLADCIYKNPSNPCQTSTRLAANVVEAIVGAACLDGGLQAAEHVMQTLGCVLPE